MYYEEKFDKFTCQWVSRTTPQGKWVPMDYETLAWAYYNHKQSTSKAIADAEA